MPSEALTVYEFSGFRLDPGRRQLVRSADGTPVAVTPKAFDALVVLVERAGGLVTRQTLSKELWPSAIVEENNLTQAIAALRRILGDGHIATVPGRGYQFVAGVRLVKSELLRADGAAPPEPSAAPPEPVPSRPKSLPRRAIPFTAIATVMVAASVVAGVALLGLGRSSSDRVGDDPLRSATFNRLTDFDDVEEHAAISRDGRFVAFLSDRDGAWDVWVGQIDSGDFRNVTGGAIAELRNPAVRTLGFTPDGLLVTLWTKTSDPRGAGVVDGGWAIPTIGGPLKPYRPGIAELDWSADGGRIVYHTSERGDPLFVTAAEDDTPRRIYAAPGTIHNHFPLWSRDGAFVYFVRGEPPDEMDLWRMSASGGEPERLTFHDSRVSFPIWLDARTLLYLATDTDGSGPWIHALDVESRVSRRLNTAGVEYASLSADAEGHRLVATAARSTGSLWRIALDEPSGSLQAPTPLAARAPRGSSPRLGAERVVYRAPRPGASAEGIWQLHNGVEAELWSGTDERAVAGPALAPDGRIAFVVQRETTRSLYVMEPNGRAAHVVSQDLDVRGAPAWSPDGAWLAIAAIHDGEPRLFKIPAAGGAPVQLGAHYALDPVWAPSGAFLVYSGADIGTNFPLAAVNADGTPHAIPSVVLSRGSRRMDFLGDDRELVILKGTLSYKEFWALDLTTGEQRRLADAGPGPIVSDFDVASDGREIVFDRIRDASDVMLIELSAL
jgi:DNA-binding winged helix-turn-helix (wHTH) protein/Tol biopolymer transport system component